MLIDLNLENKLILIFGGGTVGEFKARKVLKARSKIVVISKNFTTGLKQLEKQHSVKLIETDIELEPHLIDTLISSAKIVIVATEDEELNEVLAKKAKRYNVLVSVVDNALLSDFNSPATFTIGDIRIGICTGGKSPAMSKFLRKRFEKLITEEDILQVKLQHYVREFLKEKILDKKKHKNIIYQIINDQQIGNLLKKGNLEESKNLAKRIIKNHIIK